MNKKVFLLSTAILAILGVIVVGGTILYFYPKPTNKVVNTSNSIFPSSADQNNPLNTQTKNYPVLLVNWQDKTPYNIQYPSSWEAQPITYASAAQLEEGKTPEIIGLTFKPIVQESTDDYVQLGGNQADCRTQKLLADSLKKPLVCADAFRGMNAIYAIYTESSNPEVIGFYNSVIDFLNNGGWQIKSY
jgi:hypothetical protein